MRILHFADAHIDMVTQGRIDPETGLPVRVIDFLTSLDQIVDRAIEEAVDLVVFAGDAYKDRNPQPTYQREWGKRIMRLSQAGIPTVLLVGNHDVARASNRAHTLHEFRTLAVPYVHVGDRIELLGPKELGIPVQVLTLPWVSRSTLMTRQDTAGLTVQQVLEKIENLITSAVQNLLAQADPDLPLILTAHASVQGAKYGSERTVMLGHEVVFSHSLMRNKRIDYVALGHIHKHQDLNPDSHPPVIYPGSIERIDFGEAREQKGYVLADVKRGETTWEFVPLKTRRFIDLAIDTPSADSFMADIMDRLPDANKVAGAVCRLRLNYPRDWEPLLDENGIAEQLKEALSFQILKDRSTAKRSRLGDTTAVDQLTPLDLLETYWRTVDLEAEEMGAMQELAKEILGKTA